MSVDRVVVNLQLTAVAVEAIDLVTVTRGDAEFGDLHALTLHLLTKLRLWHPGAAVGAGAVGIGQKRCSTQQQQAAQCGSG